MTQKEENIEAENLRKIPPLQYFNERQSATLNGN